MFKPKQNEDEGDNQSNWVLCREKRRRRRRKERKKEKIFFFRSKKLKKSHLRNFDVEKRDLSGGK